METKIELQATVTKQLSDELYNKLDGKEFADEVDKLTKKFEINWYLKQDEKTIVASQTFTDVDHISPAQIYSLHADVCEFIARVERLKHEKHEQPANEMKHNKDDYNIIKKLVDTWEETENRAPTTGFAVLASIDIFGINADVPYGRIPEPLAKELCMSYLKIHSHDKN